MTTTIEDVVKYNIEELPRAETDSTNRTANCRVCRGLIQKHQNRVYIQRGHKQYQTILCEACFQDTIKEYESTTSSKYVHIPKKHIQTTYPPCEVCGEKRQSELSPYLDPTRLWSFSYRCRLHHPDMWKERVFTKYQLRMLRKHGVESLLPPYDSVTLRCKECGTTWNLEKGNLPRGFYKCPRC